MPWRHSLGSFHQIDDSTHSWTADRVTLSSTRVTTTPDFGNAATALKRALKPDVLLFAEFAEQTVPGPVWVESDPRLGGLSSFYFDSLGFTYPGLDDRPAYSGLVSATEEAEFFNTVGYAQPYYLIGFGCLIEGAPSLSVEGGGFVDSAFGGGLTIGEDINQNDPPFWSLTTDLTGVPWNASTIRQRTNASTLFAAQADGTSSWLEITDLDGTRQADLDIDDQVAPEKQFRELFCGFLGSSALHGLKVGLGNLRSTQRARNWAQPYLRSFAD